MRLTLTDIDRPWFTSPADDEIVLEGTTYGVYQIEWNKVRVGSVHLFKGHWLAYTIDGDMISDMGTCDPARAALHVLYRHYVDQKVGV